MKFCIIFTLLFAAWQGNALTVTGKHKDKHMYIYMQYLYTLCASADPLLSPRLEVTPYVGGTDAVHEAHKLLLRLQEYSLIGEVAQAKFVDGPQRSLLFEMTTPLQATNVVQAWRNVLDFDTEMKIQQVVTDFFPPPVDFRSG